MPLTAKGAKFWFQASSRRPLMFDPFPFCGAAAAAGLRRRTGRLFPVVPQGLPFQVPAIDADFSLDAGGLLPFVLMKNRAA